MSSNHGARADLYGRLAELAQQLNVGRGAATRLRAAAYEAEVSGRVDDQQLIDLEGVAGEIYVSIEAFNSLPYWTWPRKTPTDLGNLLQVGDLLHPVLLEITELGTRMYRVRSTTASRPYDALPSEGAR